MLTCQVVADCDEHAREEQKRHPEDVRKEVHDIHHDQHQVDDPAAGDQDPPNLEDHYVDPLAFGANQDEVHDDDD